MDGRRIFETCQVDYNVHASFLMPYGDMVSESPVNVPYSTSEVLQPPGLRLKLHGPFNLR